MIGRGGSVGEEHSHDWPVLSLYVTGDYTKTFDGGELRISGPSAALHPSGEAHANRLGDAGLEQVDIQFDPAWLGSAILRRLEKVECWCGGSVALAGAALRRLWEDQQAQEADLAAATRRFLEQAADHRSERLPAWLPTVSARLEVEEPVTARQLARELGLNPVWLSQAYKRATGEGIRETLMRQRVQAATSLLTESRLALADVAAAAGFYDQSHMNRSFRRLLSRTPLQVQRERAMWNLDARPANRAAA